MEPPPLASPANPFITDGRPNSADSDLLFIGRLSPDSSDMAKKEKLLGNWGKQTQKRQTK